MKELSFEKMEEVNGGATMATAVCGLGVGLIAVSWFYGGLFVFGEATAIACAAAMAELGN